MGQQSSCKTLIGVHSTMRLMHPTNKLRSCTCYIHVCVVCECVCVNVCVFVYVWCFEQLIRQLVCDVIIVTCSAYSGLLVVSELC